MLELARGGPLIFAEYFTYKTYGKEIGFFI